MSVGAPCSLNSALAKNSGAHTSHLRLSRQHQPASQWISEFVTVRAGSNTRESQTRNLPPPAPGTSPKDDVESLTRFRLVTKLVQHLESGAKRARFHPVAPNIEVFGA